MGIAERLKRVAIRKATNFKKFNEYKFAKKHPDLAYIVKGRRPRTNKKYEERIKQAEIEKRKKEVEKKKRAKEREKTHKRLVKKFEKTVKKLEKADFGFGLSPSLFEEPRRRKSKKKKSRSYDSGINWDMFRI